IECHYFVHGGWMRDDGQLLKDVGRVRHIPAYIIHGRHDVVTPMSNAWDLAKCWPEAHLKVVEDAGHAFDEPGILHELVSAMEDFKRL
ncbi:MAG TPA: prolyl aminopeptidase, partial [Alphaproteobacteria bacterium]|nr:prolyl aminopeptidase [Alphaproteobacteria bacterium]